MRVKMWFNQRTFDFITIIFVVLATDVVFGQIDSYLIGIQRPRNEISLKKSKWAKNMLSSDSCGGIFREKQVLIRSPNYPNKYPKNADCEFIFYSPFVCVNEFHIQFLDFQLEPSLSCTKDRLVISGTDEVLCGQVIGIMKYKATNGTLRIKFISDETIENKGFELLITRLPCISDDSPEDQSTISPVRASSTFNSRSVSVPPPRTTNVIPIPTNVLPIQSHVTVSNAGVESVTQSTILKPMCLKGQAQSNGLWKTTFPQSTVSPTFPAFPTLPSCCINIYNQQKFYLMSPGFPNAPRFSTDCLFYIERFHPDFCRLRVDFKYFLLGDLQERQQNQRQCTDSFLEIDGRRFCGCKTGSTFYTQWGSKTKAIRFSNIPHYTGIQGFVLEVTQEPCPYRITSSNYQPTNQIPQQNYSPSTNDPRRCSYNYLSWLNFNTNQELLAKSICIRNYG